METISEYQCEIRYHPGKANLVVDALSRKSQMMMDIPKSLEVDYENVLRNEKRLLVGKKAYVSRKVPYLPICKSALETR